MDTGFNILSRLQQHEIFPSLEIKERAWAAINAPEARADAEKPLEALQQLEIQPPDFLRPAIERRIVRPAPSRRQSLRLSFSRQRSMAFYLVSAVAASLLLILSVFAIRRAAATRQSNPLTQGSGRTTAPVAEKLPAVIPVNDSTGEKTLASSPVIPDSARPAKTDGHYTRPGSFNVLGSTYELQDNDLMTSFAGFRYGKIPGFLSSEEDLELTVRIDQYAAVHISKDMRAMMRKMYKYKNSGELTRRAKKTRQKLTEWKAADASYFDKSSGRNPLDPIDLSDFIFK